MISWNTYPDPWAISNAGSGAYEHNESPHTRLPARIGCHQEGRSHRTMTATVPFDGRRWDINQPNGTKPRAWAVANWTTSTIFRRARFDADALQFRPVFVALNCHTGLYRRRNTWFSVCEGENILREAILVTLVPVQQFAFDEPEDSARTAMEPYNMTPWTRSSANLHHLSPNGIC